MIHTQQMIADFGTKPLVQLLHKGFGCWVTGTDFLPPPGSLHFDLLQMKYYEMCFIDILRDMAASDQSS